jgi:uncharacterized membrane protein YccC
VLIGSVSAEAATCRVVADMTARQAEVRCPEARLLDADLAHCREEFEILLQLLKTFSSKVEPHRWGAVCADVGDLSQDRHGAVALGKQIGQAVRRELGQYAALPPSAVLQQFGKAGRLAQRFAQGKDDRPVISRWQTPRRTVSREPDAPLDDRERLLATMERACQPVDGCQSSIRKKGRPPIDALPSGGWGVFRLVAPGRDRAYCPD